RLFSKLVAASRAANALHQASGFELQENLHEEPRGHAVGLGNVANPHRFAPRVPGRQFEHRNAGVLGLGGDNHGDERGSAEVSGEWWLAKHHSPVTTHLFYLSLAVQSA